MVSSYTVRYRARDQHGRMALIVSDERGDAYLFYGGRLQARCAGHDGMDASAHLLRLLRHDTTWVELPPVSRASLEELRQLTQAPPGMAPPDARR